jgi:hypothetical protein
MLILILIVSASISAFAFWKQYRAFRRDRLSDDDPEEKATRFGYTKATNCEARDFHEEGRAWPPNQLPPSSSCSFFLPSARDALTKGRAWRILGNRKSPNK